MTLKPCPNPDCRSPRIFMTLAARVVCEVCSVRGPRDDPTGEKWNNLLRAEDVEAAFERGFAKSAEHLRSMGSIEDALSDLERRMGT